MDLGLLQGLAEGLKAGYQGYSTERDYQEKKRQAAEEKALKERAYKFQMTQAGYQEDPTGLLTKTPEAKQKDYTDQSLKSAQANFYNAKAKDTAAPAAPPTPAEKFKELPIENQEQIRSLSKEVANDKKMYALINQSLKILDDPTISEDQKLITARAMIKPLNSLIGSDAVGAEEAKRLAGLLEYRIMNFTEPGPFHGRAPISDFSGQVRNTLRMIGGARADKDEEINRLYGRPEKSTVVGQLPSQTPGMISKTKPPAFNRSSNVVAAERPQYNPGDIIDVKGKRMRVGMDGDTLEPIR
jgi:hypothetical protein